MGQLWRELQTAVFSTGPLLRVSIGSAVSSIVILLIFKLLIPQINLWAVWPVVFALPMMLLYIASYFGMAYLIRPTVVVSQKRISYQLGQTVERVDQNSIQSTKLVFHDADRVRLIVRYRQKEEIKRLVIGVPPDLDFFELQRLLKTEPEIVDARCERIVSIC